jgi:hypothetical protein
MKGRLMLLAVIALLLLLATSALAQSGGQPADRWTVLAGGSYRLTSLAPQAQGDTWRVSGTASSPKYRLEGAYTLQGAGCCCTYLPCMPRGSP